MDFDIGDLGLALAFGEETRIDEKQYEEAIEEIIRDEETNEAIDNDNIEVRSLKSRRQFKNEKPLRPFEQWVRDVIEGRKTLQSALTDEDPFETPV